MKRIKENSNESRILIIGSGIIGKFNALELSKLGYKITIIDPDQSKNSSNAALGILMGNIYQKRKGRSWILREQSIELWPEWIKLLQTFNKELEIKKPLIQLTTNEEKFQKLEKFISQNNDLNLKILDKECTFIKNISKAFETNHLKGIISLKDGIINPQSLLNTIDNYLKNKKVVFLKDKIIKIKKSNKKWISLTSKNEEIKSEAIILCNSLDVAKLIDHKSHNVKLKPVLGQAMEISINHSFVNLLSLPKHFNINGKNIIPISKSRLTIGSTDEYSTKPGDNIFEKLTNFLDKKPKWLENAKITKQWFGVRSQPDGEPSPVMKNLEDGLILCTGFYKNGFLLAPACSKWVAMELKRYLS